MQSNRRKFYGDGRQRPDHQPRPLPPEIADLDRVPSRKLPPEVTTVFFGGGWYPLCHYRIYDGLKDGHIVWVSPFYISLRPVSIGLWKEIEGNYEKAHAWEDESKDLKPAYVTWNSAWEFCNKLSARDGLQPCYYTDSWTCQLECNWNANGYRLPTEAEFNYATPGYRCRLPGRPSPFPRSVDMEAYQTTWFGSSDQDLICAYDYTMFWDYFDPRYFRDSPRYDPTGPRPRGRDWNWGYHSCRYYPITNYPSNHSFKPYRRPVCNHSRHQFYTVRNRIFDYNLHHTNLLNHIPQWDL